MEKEEEQKLEEEKGTTEGEMERSRAPPPPKEAREKGQGHGTDGRTEFFTTYLSHCNFTMYFPPTIRPLMYMHILTEQCVINK